MTCIRCQARLSHHGLACTACGAPALSRVERNAHGHEVFVRTDGTRMVLVPGGTFRMGSEQGARDERPVHPVTLQPFLIDETPVTWGAYAAFVHEAGAELPPAPGAWELDGAQPVVNVTWEEAWEYCEHRGARLPTEAERELAARGLEGRKYPWGPGEPTPREARYNRSWDEGPPAVGLRPDGASPFGVLDLSGPVLEWVADWYSAGYGDAGPRLDPQGPAHGRLRVARGASFATSHASALRGAARTGLSSARHPHVGFRCALTWPRR